MTRPCLEQHCFCKEPPHHYSRGLDFWRDGMIHGGLLLLNTRPILPSYLQTWWMDIKCLELVQRRATKFVMKGTAMDYKNRLMYLHLLPLMMELEIADIIFLIKSLKFPSEHFNILNYVKFCDNPTRSSSHFKLRHSFCKNQSERNFYFNRIPPPLEFSTIIWH